MSWSIVGTPEAWNSRAKNESLSSPECDTEKHPKGMAGFLFYFIFYVLLKTVQSCNIESCNTATKIHQNNKEGMDPMLQVQAVNARGRRPGWRTLEIKLLFLWTINKVEQVFRDVQKMFGKEIELEIFYMLIYLLFMISESRFFIWFWWNEI